MTASENVAPHNRPARWPQISLRWLLAMVLLAGVLLGRYGVKELAIARERAALGEMQRYGANAQLQNRRVVGLSFSGADFRDEALSHTKQLPHLQRLVLIDTALSDAGLAHIASLASLEQLLVFDAKVTDRGLQRLTELPHLRTLRLDHTPISDAGLEHVAKIRSLERLDLAGTNISDAGLEQLVVLPHLKQLYVRQTQVSETGAQALGRQMPDLTIVR